MILFCVSLISSVEYFSSLPLFLLPKFASLVSSPSDWFVGTVLLISKERWWGTSWCQRLGEVRFEAAAGPLADESRLSHSAC